MKKVLSLVDISPYLYAGSIDTRAIIHGDVRVNDEGVFARESTYVGGIRFLLKALQSMQGTDIILCWDSAPTNKKEYFAEFKSQRTKPNIPVSEQRRWVKEVLADCGYAVLEREGYEADDLIYTLVKDYVDDYDKINVYVRDADVHLVVQEKVTIMPPSSNAKTVTAENFRYQCITNQVIPPGMCTLFLACYGKASNNIPAHPNGRAIWYDLETRYPNGIPWAVAMDLDLLLEMVMDFTPMDFRYLLCVHFPIYVDSCFMLESEPKQGRVALWLQAFSSSGSSQDARVKEIINNTLYGKGEG